MMRVGIRGLGVDRVARSLVKEKEADSFFWGWLWI